MDIYEIKSFLKYFDRCKKDNQDLCIVVTIRETRRHIVKNKYMLEGFDSNYKYICFNDIFTNHEAFLIDEDYMTEYYGYPIIKNEKGKLSTSKHIQRIIPGTVMDMNFILKKEIKII